MGNRRRTHPDGSDGDGDPFREFVVAALDRLMKDSERAELRWQEERRLRAEEHGQLVSMLQESSRLTVEALKEVSAQLDANRVAMGRLNAQMERVNAQMERVGAQMELVGTQMEHVSAQMKEVAAELRALRATRRPPNGDDGRGA